MIGREPSLKQRGSIISVKDDPKILYLRWTLTPTVFESLCQGSNLYFLANCQFLYLKNFSIDVSKVRYTDGISIELWALL